MCARSRIKKNENLVLGSSLLSLWKQCEYLTTSKDFINFGQKSERGRLAFEYFRR